MFRTLPIEVVRSIFEFDPTYRALFNRCMAELELNCHILRRVYFCYTEAPNLAREVKRVCREFRKRQLLTCARWMGRRGYRHYTKKRLIVSICAMLFYEDV